MVLPSSTANAAAPPDWLRRVERALRLGRHAGVMVLVQDARLENLRHLIVMLRALAGETAGDVYACLSARGLVDLPSGAVVVLNIAADDIEWLNENRPIVAERRLRVVLWSEPGMTEELKRKAPDFFDWISHLVDNPPAVPAFAVAGVGRARRFPGLVWHGHRLREVLSLADPGREIRVGPASAMSGPHGYRALITTLVEHPEAWLIVERVATPREVTRIRWAMAETRHAGRVVLERPTCETPGWWPVSDTCMEWRDAVDRLAGVEKPELLAALLDLEPSAVELAAAVIARGAWSSDAFDEVARASDPGAALARWARTPRLIEILDDIFDPAHIASWDTLPCVLRSAFDDPDVCQSRHALPHDSQRNLEAYYALPDVSSWARWSSTDLTLWANTRPSFERISNLLALDRTWPPLRHWAHVIEAALRKTATEASLWPSLVTAAVDVGYEDIAAYWASHRPVDVLTQALVLHTPVSAQQQEDALQQFVETLWSEQGERSEGRRTLFTLVELYRREGRLQRAEEALQIALDSGALDFGSACRARLIRADILAARGVHDDSEALLLALLDEAGTHGDIAHAVQAEVRYSLANLAEESADAHHGDTLFRRALVHAEHAYGATHPVYMGIRLGLAAAILNRGQHAAAESEFRTIVNIAIREFGESTRFHVTALCGLALSLAGQNDDDETETLAKAVSAYRDHVRPGSWYRERSWLSLIARLDHVIGHPSRESDVATEGVGSHSPRRDRTVSRGISDDRLMRAWQTGDERAGEQLFRRYDRELSTHLVKRGVRLAEVPDLIQEIVFEVYRKPSDKDYRQRLYEEASDVLRRRNRSVDVREVPMEVWLDPELRDRFEVLYAVQEALTALPATLRHVLTSYYWDGRSIQEISDSTGISPRTVRGHLRRARDLMRDLLEG